MRLNGGILLAAILTGLFTGLLVSSAEEFFSRDGTLGGIEALATFIPFPLLAALFVSIGLRQRHIIRRMVGVAYLGWSSRGDGRHVRRLASSAIVGGVSSRIYRISDVDCQG